MIFPHSSPRVYTGTHKRCVWLKSHCCSCLLLFKLGGHLGKLPAWKGACSPGKLLTRTGVLGSWFLTSCYSTALLRRCGHLPLGIVQTRTHVVAGHWRALLCDFSLTVRTKVESSSSLCTFRQTIPLNRQRYLSLWRTLQGVSLFV